MSSEETVNSNGAALAIMASGKVRRVDPLSATSLRIQPFFEGIGLATATGFTINVAGKDYLITNWHVVSGRNCDTNECLDKNASIPDTLAITFHSKKRLGEWERVTVPLRRDGEPLWIEHPMGQLVD